MKTRACASIGDAYLYATSPHMFPGAQLASFARVRDKVRICHLLGHCSRHKQRALPVQVKIPLYGCDCYAYGLLAAGFVDLVVEASMQPYDFLALAPIVQGAGGVITDWQVSCLLRTGAASWAVWSSVCLCSRRASRCTGLSQPLARTRWTPYPKRSAPAVTQACMPRPCSCWLASRVAQSLTSRTERRLASEWLLVDCLLRRQPGALEHCQITQASFSHRTQSSKESSNIR